MSAITETKVGQHYIDALAHHIHHRKIESDDGGLDADEIDLDAGFADTLDQEAEGHVVRGHEEHVGNCLGIHRMHGSMCGTHFRCVEDDDALRLVREHLVDVVFRRGAAVDYRPTRCRFARQQIGKQWAGAVVPHHAVANGKYDVSHQRVFTIR